MTGRPPVDCPSCSGKTVVFTVDDLFADAPAAGLGLFVCVPCIEVWMVDRPPELGWLRWLATGEPLTQPFSRVDRELWLRIPELLRNRIVLLIAGGWVFKRVREDELCNCDRRRWDGQPLARPHQRFPYHLDALEARNGPVCARDS